jgi:hypothetical protein
MKGKKLTEFDILSSLRSGFGGVLYESEEQNQNRKTGNTDGDGWTVDTCYAPDTGKHETGITCKWINNGDWVIVEQYESEKDSVKGHKKWVKHMNTKPKKLYSIQTEEWES